MVVSRRFLISLICSYGDIISGRGGCGLRAQGRDERAHASGKEQPMKRKRIITEKDCIREFYKPI
jgi:hypothetical protein